jgi:hypothetical protein
VFPLLCEDHDLFDINKQITLKLIVIYILWSKFLCFPSKNVEVYHKHSRNFWRTVAQENNGEGAIRFVPHTLSSYITQQNVVSFTTTVLLHSIGTFLWSNCASLRVNSSNVSHTIRFFGVTVTEKDVHTST